MKNKGCFSKTVATLLCIVTITLSQNIYFSFKDLYFKEESYTENIIYTVMANTSLNNSLDNSNISIKHNAQPLHLNPKIKSNKDYHAKKILINVFLLFLSFITLASLHNFILKIEAARGYDFINLSNKVKNKDTNINLTSSFVSEEGVKKC